MPPVKSPKDYLLLVLAVTTLGCAVLAWRQYDELVAFRAAAMTGNERAEWQKRVWDADKRRAATEEQLAKLEHDETQDRGGALAAADQTNPQRNRRGDRAGEFMAMMDKPEMQKLVALQQRGALDARYASLFKSMNLTPEQLAQFKNLLVEKQTSMMDVLAAARAQGINPRTDPEAFRQLVTDAQSEINTSIKSALGDAGYAQYQNYEQTLPQRNTVSQLDQRLSYTPTPLTATQSEQMVALLASAAAARPAGDTGNLRSAMFPGGGPGGLAGGGTTKITDTTINQAQGMLTGPQVDALRQLQQEQAAQAQLAQAMRAQFGGQNPRGQGAATPTTTPTTKGGPGGG